MTGKPTLRLTELAGLFRRLATGLAAGIDVRRAWRSEIERTKGALQAAVAGISGRLDQGESLADAAGMLERGDGAAFPPLVRRLWQVAERTGELPAVLKRLAEHYDFQVQTRRLLWTRLAWPLTMLGLAVMTLVVWLFLLPRINIARGVKSSDGTTTIVWLLIGIGIVVGLAAALYGLSQRNANNPLAGWDDFLARIPLLGNYRTLRAVSNVADVLEITTKAGTSPGDTLVDALAASGDARFIRQQATAHEQIEAGRELHVVLASMNLFPRDFIDAVEVGEESGRLDESLAHLSRRFAEESQRSAILLTKGIAAVITTVVVLLIAGMILKMGSSYAGILNNRRF